MGKSWKENPNKWKNNKGFQKKKQRQKRSHMPLKQNDPYPNDHFGMPTEPEDFERRSGIGGTNDYAYGM